MVLGLSKGTQEREGLRIMNNMGDIVFLNLPILFQQCGFYNCTIMHCSMHTLLSILISKGFMIPTQVLDIVLQKHH